MALSDDVDDVIGGYPYALPIQPWEQTAGGNAPPLATDDPEGDEMLPPLLVAGGFDFATLAKELMPHVLAHLRSFAPPEPKAMADAAAETPGLDALAMYALADWLEEKRFSSIAGKVRKLAIEDGDLLVIETDKTLSMEARKNLRASMDAVVAKLGKKNVVAVVLDQGMTLRHIRTGDAAPNGEA